MAVSAVSAAGIYSASQQPVQSASQHKHGGHHSRSISDIDAQGSSVATAASSTGKVGSKVDISV
jgi:hypothetical protein